MSKTTKKKEVEVCEVKTKTPSPLEQVIENYKLQSPKKYELKKEELLKKLETNK